MRRAAGCLVAAAVLGLAAIGGVSMCVGFAHKGQPSSDVNAEIAASAASAKAKAASDLEARFRKDCKRPDAGTIFPIYDVDLHSLCEAHVRETLKVPGSGEFPAEVEATPMTTDDGCRRIFTSTYTAQNVLGVKVRSAYRCTYDPRTGTIAIKDLE